MCIIGGGPAGLTLAAELAYDGLRICVLESGGEKATGFADALKKTVSLGLSVKSNSRHRALGGAGAVWGGLSAPLDAVDLEERPWSAPWPVARQELERYLDETQRYGFPALAEFAHPRPYWPFKTLQEKLFLAIRPPYNFARLRTVFERDGVDIFLEATVVKLTSRVEGGAAAVAEAVCKTPQGAESRVRARVFVVAGGGIENPRLLLASALGNAHDQVGRYFMNHPKGYAGRLRLNAPLPATSPYLPRSSGGRMRYAGLALPESVRRAEGLLSSYVQFEPDLGFLQRFGFALWRRLPARAGGLFNLLRPRTLRLRWFADMEPRPDNRVTLSDEKDCFGVPLPAVNYALGLRDKKTLQALHARLGEEVRRLGLGTLEGTAQEAVAAAVDDASHHLGGTRMGDDPRTSVVNRDCLVHGSTNLYVAGGSVFPAGGSANPTYTIVALAIRLAEHLRRTLSPQTEAAEEKNTAGDGIIIIGAGGRISGDVVPALESLAGTLSILGIYARHAGAVFGASRRYEVRPVAELTAGTLAKARFAYVTVPPASLGAVLAALPPSLELFVDTPAPLERALQKKLLQYKRVHIAEDSVFLPWLSDVKKPVRTMLCDRSVYRYHGIALIKALCGKVRFGWRWGNTLWLRAGSAWVKIIEPRDYEHGRLFINGQEIEGVAPRMHELKREGLRRLLIAAAKGEKTWSLQDGINDARIDHLLHRYRIYISL